MKEKVFYVYLDWTIEDLPRIFYVGKGQGLRIDNLRRNKFHQNIAAKYGHRREVLLSTKDEAFAYEMEVKLTALHHTYIHDSDYVFGANLTIGGEGRTAKGFRQSDEVIAGIRAKLQGRKRNPEEYAHLVGVSRPKEVGEAISKGLKGHSKSPEWRAALSASVQAHNASPEFRKHMSDIKLGKKLNVGRKRFQNMSRNWFLFGRRTAKDPMLVTPIHPRKNSEVDD